MADSLLNNFIEGMKQLGFTKEELIRLLEHKYDVNNKQ